MNLCSWSWLVCVVFAVAFVQCCSAKVSAQADVCFTFGGGQHVSLNVCTVGLLLFRLFVGNQANMRKSIWIASARIVARRRYRQLRNRAPCGVWLCIQSSLLLSADDQTTVKKISRTLVQTKLQQHVRHCSQDMMDNSMVDHLRLLLACYVFARPKLSLLSLTIDIACATSLVTGVHFQSQFCCMFFLLSLTCVACQLPSHHVILCFWQRRFFVCFVHCLAKDLVRTPCIFQRLLWWSMPRMLQKLGCNGVRVVRRLRPTVNICDNLALTKTEFSFSLSSWLQMSARRRKPAYSSKSKMPAVGLKKFTILHNAFGQLKSFPAIGIEAHKHDKLQARMHWQARGRVWEVMRPLLHLGASENADSGKGNVRTIYSGKAFVEAMVAKYQEKIGTAATVLEKCKLVQQCFKEISSQASSEKISAANMPTLGLTISFRTAALEAAQADIFYMGELAICLSKLGAHDLMQTCDQNSSTRNSFTGFTNIGNTCFF